VQFCKMYVLTCAAVGIGIFENKYSSGSSSAIRVSRPTVVAQVSLWEKCDWKNRGVTSLTRSYKVKVSNILPTCM
jgi:hypothetical protein